MGAIVSGKSEWVKGTKVLGVHSGHLYLLTGNEWKLFARKEKMEAPFHEEARGNSESHNAELYGDCGMRGGAGSRSAVGTGFWEEKRRRERGSSGSGAGKIGVSAEMRGVPLRQ